VKAVNKSGEKREAEREEKLRYFSVLPVTVDITKDYFSSDPNLMKNVFNSWVYVLFFLQFLLFYFSPSLRFSSLLVSSLLFLTI
jgi:hypothetical protein